MVNRISIAIGDYSSDGHAECEYKHIICSHDGAQLEELYIQSCVLTGLQFQTNGDTSGRNRQWGEMDKYKVLQNYQQCKITEFQKEIFEKFKIEVGDLDYSYDTDRFLKLFMDFISISDSSLSWKYDENKTNKLEMFIGYGIFDC